MHHPPASALQIVSSTWKPEASIDPAVSGWQRILSALGSAVEFPSLPIPVRRDGILVAMVVAVELRGDDWWGLVEPVSQDEAFADVLQRDPWAQAMVDARAKEPARPRDPEAERRAFDRAMVGASGPVCDVVIDRPLVTDADWASAYRWTAVALYGAAPEHNAGPDHVTMLVTAQPDARENGVYLVRHDGSHQRASLSEDGRSWTQWGPGVELHVGDRVRMSDGRTYEVVRSGTGEGVAVPDVRREFVSTAPGMAGLSKAQRKKILVGDVWRTPQPQAPKNRHQRRKDDALRRRARP